jgi:hypothetical protein
MWPGSKRERVAAFITGLLEHWKPATANNRYRSFKIRPKTSHS